MLSNQEVINNSRSLRNGVEGQRRAIQEARRRGIFDAQAHLAASPMGRAVANGLDLQDVRA